MYESPITQMLDKMKMHYEDGVYKAVQHVGFDVNKEELIKALQYDREQYTKGYKDGYAKAINDYMTALCDKCLDMKNECYQLECPFCSDGCDVVNIAEQLKGE